MSTLTVDQTKLLASLAWRGIGWAIAVNFFASLPIIALWGASKYDPQMPFELHKLVMSGTLLVFSAGRFAGILVEYLSAVRLPEEHPLSKAGFAIAPGLLWFVSFFMWFHL